MYDVKLSMSMSPDLRRCASVAYRNKYFPFAGLPWSGQEVSKAVIQIHSQPHWISQDGQPLGSYYFWGCSNLYNLDPVLLFSVVDDDGLFKCL